jgi:hypothetical protein
MRLIVLTVLVALAAGLLSGGTLRDFPTVETRWWWLALVGVAVQLFTLGGAAETMLLLASFVVLIVFVAANVRAPGFVLVLTGLLLNVAVIGANQGMPVTRNAIVASGQQDTLTELTADDDGHKHLLADDDTVLLPLADVIPVGRPVRQAISVGDICVHLGIAWFIVMAMRRRSPTRTLEPGAAEA